MAGHAPLRGNLESVDYKGMRALKSFYSEFHHITDVAFLYPYANPHSFIHHIYHTTMKTFRNIALCLTASLLMSSCVPQIILNYALKRDEAKDLNRYEMTLKGYKGRNANWMAEVRDTTMKSPNNGALLHAIYRKADRPTGKTAVILHGYSANSASMLNMARFYNMEMGYNVLLPDFYAHGKSEGKMRQMGWLDRIDMIEWMKMANRMFGVNGAPTQMLVTGVSMGGATTMMVSGEVEKQGLDFVKCFVEDCGYSDVYDQFSAVVKGKYGIFLKWADFRCRRKYGWGFKEASSVRQVEQCKLPMLFIHGGADTFVPTKMVNEVSEAKKEGPSELWIPKGVGHGRSFDMRNAEYKSLVKKFAEKYM